MEKAVRISTCPHCQGAMHTRSRECRSCAIEIRADFDESPLTLLAREEQDFLLQFILSAGNLKALGERLDLSYPTLRSRLDRIITRLEALSSPPDAPDFILEAVDRGTLSADAALQKLRHLTSRKGEVS